MYLVKNGEPCGVIGLEPSASEPVSFAAAELQRYLLPDGSAGAVG